MSNFIKTITEGFDLVPIKFCKLDKDLHKDLVEVIKSRKKHNLDFTDESTFDQFTYNGWNIRPLKGENTKGYENRSFVVNEEEYVFPKAKVVYCNSDAKETFFGEGAGTVAYTKRKDEAFYPFAYVPSEDKFKLFRFDLRAGVPGEYEESLGINSSLLLDLMVEVRKMKKDEGIYIFRDPDYPSSDESDTWEEDAEIDSYVTLSFFVKEGDEYPVILSYRSGFYKEPEKVLVEVNGKKYEKPGKIVVRDFRLDYFCNSIEEVNDYPKRGWTSVKFDKISKNDILGKYIPSLGDYYEHSDGSYGPYYNYDRHNTFAEFGNSMMNVLDKVVKDPNIKLGKYLSEYTYSGFRLNAKSDRMLIMPFYNLAKVLGILQKGFVVEEPISLADYEEAVECLGDPYFNQLLKEIGSKVDLSKESRPFISKKIAKPEVIFLVDSEVNSYTVTSEFSLKAPYIEGVEVNLMDVISDTRYVVSRYDLSNLRNFYIDVTVYEKTFKIYLNDIAEFFPNIRKSQRVFTKDLEEGNFKIIETRVNKDGLTEYRVRPILEKWDPDRYWSDKDPRK
jgi:hypothetical protein